MIIIDFDWLRHARWLFGAYWFEAILAEDARASIMQVYGDGCRTYQLGNGYAYITRRAAKFFDLAMMVTGMRFYANLIKNQANKEAVNAEITKGRDALVLV
jgi:hypothetical protein